LSAEQLIILDRDGVINRDRRDYVKTLEEWVPLPGSLEAIAALSRAGYRVAIASNQSGIARGIYSAAVVHAVHAEMQRRLATLGCRAEVGLYFCPHQPEDNCGCRKPKPGLLTAIGESLGVSLTGVPMVGDALRDVQAAQAVGARPFLVRTGHGFETLRQHGPLPGVDVFDDLLAFTRDWLSRGN